MSRSLLPVVCGLLASSILAGCSESSRPDPDGPIRREDAIPADAVKMTPETDAHPPVLLLEGWEPPVPILGEVNTAGVEDGAFVTPDGANLYFFFTPDGSVPPERQLLDRVSGIYVARRTGASWGPVERILLQENGKLALDGCPCAQGSVLWFCSAREGVEGILTYTAHLVDGRWSDWGPIDPTLNFAYEVGELHVTADGRRIYFHSARSGGRGGLDIWVADWIDGGWREPRSIDAVNSEGVEGWPFVTEAEDQLWFTRFHQGAPGVFRSRRVEESWTEPEMVVWPFAGEPSLDREGNLYFVHHFYKESRLIEADVYRAARRRPGP